MCLENENMSYANNLKIWVTFWFLLLNKELMIKMNGTKFNKNKTMRSNE